MGPPVTPQLPPPNETLHARLELAATFAVDEVVRVHGERGTFRVKGVALDGSLKLWGGPEGQLSFRSVMPALCRRTRQAGPDRKPEMAPPASRKAGRR